MNPVKGVLVHAEHGAVSTENKLCSDIGVDILKDGGSAVDAAIGATICIGTVNMYSSGIGGGGFAVVRTKSGKTTSFNFREEAPQSTHQNMFSHDPMLAQIGGLSVAVP